jgi:hypothetical protein
MWTRWARTKLRVSLRSHIIRMNFARKFHEFNEITVFEHSRKDKTSCRNLIAILIIDFIAMAVTF